MALAELDRAILAPYAERYRAVLDGIGELSDNDLVLLEEAASACTTTNCGWDEFGAARAILGEVRAEIRKRTSNPSSNSSPQGGGERATAASAGAHGSEATDARGSTAKPASERRARTP